MKKDVVVVKENDSIEDLLEFFKKHCFHTYPVVKENGDLSGIIDQDIILDILLFHRIPRVKHTHMEAFRSLGVNAKSIMITHPVTISPDTELDETADLMLKHHVNSVCVVDRGKLVGIVSKLDIINEVIKRKRVE